MSALVLRSAEASDEAEIAALWRACGLTTSYNDPGEDFHFARAKPNSDVLVYVDDKNHITGTVMVGHEGHRGWVYYVAVHPDARKQKIGARLMKAAEDWLRERGIRKLLLLVRDTNTQVVEFYSRVGYQAVPRTVMEKWLIPPPSGKNS